MEWEFPISPVAASRPRISRRGAYFAGPYKKWRQEMVDLVPMLLGDSFVPLTGSIEVDLELYVTHPKKTKLKAPRADIDNYIKAVFDSFNGWLWEDDTQIIKVYATKQWTNPKHDGYFVIGVNQV
jgi:Holliday junction resolvase RusA-like endonuclease